MNDVPKDQHVHSNGIARVGSVLTYRWLAGGVLIVLLSLATVLWQGQASSGTAQELRITGLAQVQALQGERTAALAARLDGVERQLARIEAKIDQLGERLRLP